MRLPQALVARELFDLRGRVVIVTGGAKGIGKIYSSNLAEVGARVVVADVDSAACDEIVTAIEGAGGEAIAVPVDVSDPPSVQRMAKETLQHFGQIDGLINNAALMSGLPRRAWHEIPLDEWDRVMNINVRGMFVCCQAVYPAMRERQRGKIVNISSGGIFKTVPGRLHYAISKTAVVGLTRALAAEVGNDNIAVNTVAPGLTLSETEPATTDVTYHKPVIDGRFLKRPQYPEDLVGTVMFLLSDASNFITGQLINVDGGFTLY